MTVLVGSTLVAGYGVAQANPTPWRLIVTGLNGYSCQQSGIAGEQAGAWDDYRCVPAIDGLQLWVRNL
jgi:hypothetical protein